MFDFNVFQDLLLWRTVSVILPLNTSLRVHLIKIPIGNKKCHLESILLQLHVSIDIDLF